MAKATATKKVTKSKVKKETTRVRPVVSTREGKIHMLASTGLSNGAIWSAMEAEYPQIIQDDARRYEIAGKKIPFDAEERGRVSRAINSTRGLAKKADDEGMALVRLTGGDVVEVKNIDDVDMANRHRFSWGIPALDFIYGQTNYVHLTDHPQSKYRTEQKKIITRDEHGVKTETIKNVQVWVKGKWRKNDPLIPLHDGSGYEITRDADGNLLQLDMTRQIVEHGCPEAFMSIWGGEPGVGKTRTAIRAAKQVNLVTHEAILYINGEAPEADFRSWVGNDVDAELFKVVSATKIPVDRVCQMAYQVRPRLIIIDSVQTLLEWESTKGQVLALEVLKNLKADVRAGSPHILAISQLNKAGDLSGARSLEHLADFVAEVTKVEGKKNHFLLECPRKNRGGETPRGAIFRHTGTSIECVSTGDLVVDPIFKLAQPTSSVIAAGIVPPPPDATPAEPDRE